MEDQPDPSSDFAGPAEPGDSAHPDHALWLTALGEAVDAAARLATAAFDLLRVLGGDASDSMYRSDLGGLERRVRSLQDNHSAPPKELEDFLAALTTARETRNDLLHALRVRDGLYRRTSGYIREFSSVASLREAAHEMRHAASLGNRALYADGGVAVQNWYASGGS